MIQLGKFVSGWVGWGGVVADTNYLYPARWGWINNIYLMVRKIRGQARVLLKLNTKSILC